MVSFLSFEKVDRIVVDPIMDVSASNKLG